MRIAHFSDFHLCTEHGGKRLRDLCLAVVAEALSMGAEHLVFTGDLVDYANHDDLRAFLRGLRDLGIRDGRRCTLVVGNHDIFPVSWNHRVDTRSISSCIQAYGKATSRFRTHEACLEDAWDAPRLKVLGDDTILVVMSSLACGKLLGRFASAAGRFTEADMQDVERMLAAEDLPRFRHRVLALHHPPFPLPKIGPVTMTLENHPAVQRFIRRCGFDVVLCGHTHCFLKRELSGAKVLCSASQVVPDDAVVGFHLIDLGRTIRISEHHYS